VAELRWRRYAANVVSASARLPRKIGTSERERLPGNILGVYRYIRKTSSGYQTTTSILEISRPPGDEYLRVTWKRHKNRATSFL
jgi:hypothetical protein